MHVGIRLVGLDTDVLYYNWHSEALLHDCLLEVSFFYYNLVLHNWLLEMLAINYLPLICRFVHTVNKKPKILDYSPYCLHSWVTSFLNNLQGCFSGYLFDSFYSLRLRPLIITFGIVVSFIARSYHGHKRT